MKTFTKVSIVLTIIVVIGGTMFSTMLFNKAETAELIEFFGFLPNLFLFLGGIAVIIYAVGAIALIWAIYGITMLSKFLYNKLTPKGQRILKIVLLGILGIIIVGVIVSFVVDKYFGKVDLYEELSVAPDSELYDNSTNFFIYNDKIYYYKLENNYNYTELYDRLYVVNLDGTGKKVLNETDELRYATFYFVYNNEAYYYTIYYDQNKKINLSTGEITDVNITEDIFIGKTLADGNINTYYNNPVAGKEYFNFAKINLNSNEYIYNVQLNRSLPAYEIYFDYDNGYVYYIEDFYTDVPTLYRNEEKMCEIEEDCVFLMNNNEYIYMYDKEKIYKINVNAKKIEDTIDCDITDITRISTGNNEDNYFYSNNKIYTYNFTTDKFEIILENIENEPANVYNINNRLIFTENTNNLYNYHNGSVIIYNKFSDEIEKYTNVKKSSLDENYLYIMIQKEETYYVEKVLL